MRSTRASHIYPSGEVRSQTRTSPAWNSHESATHRRPSARQPLRPAGWPTATVTSLEGLPSGGQFRSHVHDKGVIRRSFQAPSNTCFAKRRRRCPIVVRRKMGKTMERLVKIFELTLVITLMLAGVALEVYAHLKAPAGVTRASISKKETAGEVSGRGQQQDSCVPATAFPSPLKPSTPC